MRKLLLTILLVFMTSFSFAETLTYLETVPTVPAQLQGIWNQEAVSRNEGALWIRGFTAVFTITANSVTLAELDLTVTSVDRYTDEYGRAGYLLRFTEMREVLEFWFLDDGSVLMMMHHNKVESIRSRLRK